MKSPLLLLLSLVIPNCRPPEKGDTPVAVVRKAAVAPAPVRMTKDRPRSVDGIVELY